MKRLNLTHLTEIAEQARNEVYIKYDLETPEQIHEGYCTDFAKAMTNKLNIEGYESTIVVTDNFELMDELKDYETVAADYSSESHCYVMVEDDYDTYYYDAFDIEGVDDEVNLKYHTL